MKAIWKILDWLLLILSALLCFAMLIYSIWGIYVHNPNSERASAIFMFLTITSFYHLLRRYKNTKKKK